MSALFIISIGIIIACFMAMLDASRTIVGYHFKRWWIRFGIAAIVGMVHYYILPSYERAWYEWFFATWLYIGTFYLVFDPMLNIWKGNLDVLRLGNQAWWDIRVRKFYGEQNYRYAWFFTELVLWLCSLGFFTGIR